MSEGFNLPRRLLLWSRSPTLRTLWRATVPRGLRQIASDSLLSAFEKRQLAARVDSKTVLLSDFPRCGNTWIRYMLATFLRWRETGAVVKLGSDDFYRYCPTLAGQESFKPYYFGDHISLLKTHLPYRSEFRRGIVTYRDPFEAARSLHVLIEQGTLKLQQDTEVTSDLDEFLIRWMDTFQNFYSGWLAARDRCPSDFHFVRYEDLVSDTPRSLTAMVAFLGLEIPAEIIERVSALYTRRDVSWRDENSWSKRQEAETSLHEKLSLANLKRLDPKLATTISATLDRLDAARATSSTH